MTREQTRNLALTAEKNGCLTMVGFNRRFIPLIREVRQRVDEHGPMLQCVATFYKNSIGAGPTTAARLISLPAMPSTRWICCATWAASR